jgi:hypothetical protein
MDSLMTTILLHVGHNHCGPFSGERQSRGAANSRTAPGDESDFAIELSWHRSFSFTAFITFITLQNAF